MHVASILLAALSAAAIAQPAKPSALDTLHKIITVTEGTNMAVAVSPDGKTLIIDLQGMLYSLPSTGEKAKQLTGPLVEASHPEYSPDGNQVLLQSYHGVTFHIWLDEGRWDRVAAVDHRSWRRS